MCLRLLQAFFYICLCICTYVLHFSANLSQSYFTDRQDRYLQFCQCSDMANYFCDIIQTVSEFSFHLQCNNETSYPVNTPHPYLGEPFYLPKGFSLFFQFLAVFNVILQSFWNYFFFSPNSPV